MGTVNWDYWLEEVIQTIPGADRDLVRYHVRAAAIEFCKLSEAWRLEALPIDITAGQSLYWLESPLSSVEILNAVAVTINGRDVPIISKAEIQTTYANQAKVGMPCHYFQQSSSQMMLFPTPNFDQENGLNYTVAVYPTRASNGMDEDLGKEYFEAIADGAIARIYKLPRRPWSDGAAFALFEKRMKDAAESAKTRANKGLGRGALRTKPFLIGGR